MPGTPLVQMTGSGVTSSATKTSKSHSKEPKFVPYEPYKAAVTKIVPQSAKLGRRKSSLALVKAGQTAQNDVDEVKHSASTTTSSAQSSQLTPAVPPPGQKPSREDRLVTGLLDEANTKIKDLETCLAEAEKQLKIQTQVCYCC